jgi:integrase
MDIKSAGSPRSKNKIYPKHIDPAKVPKNCYWDSSGKGHWYTKIQDIDGKWRRKRIFGSTAKLSDLYEALKTCSGVDIDTVDYLGAKFLESPQFSKLSEAQKKLYLYAKNIVATQETRKNGIFLGQIPLHDWQPPLIQRLLDLVGTERGPSAARKTYEYLRRLFNWAVLRGFYKSANPVVKNMELPEERKRRRLPEHDILAKIIILAIDRGQRKTRTKGSCAPYIWIVILIAYETRLRGVEVFDLRDSDILEEGLRCDRRKGSNGNITLWNQNLKVCIDSATKARTALWAHNARPVPLKADDRPIVVNQNGEAIKQDSWQSAWGRFMDLAVSEKIITNEQRFGLHDMKRRGATDTKGTKTEKLSAVGLSSLQVLKIYDHSIEVVSATSGN